MIDYKKDFPLLKEKNLVYLDNAATSQRPRQVLLAEQKFYKKYNANPLRGLYTLGFAATEQYEHAREKVREFIHARSMREIIFTKNTTESINLTAYSYGLTHLNPGDEILVTIMEHHSNLLPWQMVARQTGAKLVYLECEQDGRLSDEKIAAVISERTKFAAVGLVSNVLGRRNPVEKIIKMVHEKGGVVLVDAAQAVLHETVDVTVLDADFLAFSGHKMLAPMGIGVLYGKEALLEKMPPFLSGGEMIESVTRESAVYAELPHKFEAGTVNGTGAVGLAAAIDYISEIGMDTIQKRERELEKLLFDGMSQIPYVHILGSAKPEEHGGILSFVVDGVHPHDIATILDDSQIAVRAGHHCAQPLLRHLGVMSSVRASLSFYNDEKDIECFLKCLAGVRRRMGYGK